MTRVSPLHAICPYFAMFPPSFARDQIEKHTKPGDLVLDCFSGRGTTLLEALLLNRQAAAIDINPVACCVSGAKARVPEFDDIEGRLDDLSWMYGRYPSSVFDRDRDGLPEFFGRAFHRETLRQLLFLRRALEWRRSSIDRFIAAMALGSLHGEMDKSNSYFSNQMPRTISTKPAYSLAFWRQRNLWPKKRNVFEVLSERLERRFDGPQPSERGRVVMGDVRRTHQLLPGLKGRVRAVVTSPPYYDVTNFEEDQWLRLWFLGFDPRPTYSAISRDDRHRSKDPSSYWKFLTASWQGIQPLMHRSSVLVCRIGARGIEQQAITRRLNQTVRVVFPKARLQGRPVATVISNRQTELFRPGSKGCRFEIDYTYLLNG